MKKRLVPLFLAAAVAGGCAQSASTRLDPAAPSATARALEYRSAFAGYASFGDEPITPWRDANEAVKQGDGQQHRGH